METGEDYQDMWLPTLDTRLKVGEDNRVLHGFYEKPTSSNLTVQRRTAMGEDAKIQVLSNDLVRRLKNNSEQAGAELCQAQGKIFFDYHSIGEAPPCHG